MIKNISIAALSICCTLYGLSAQAAERKAPVFQNEIVKGKDIFKRSSVIPVTLKLTCPENCIFRGLGINAYIYDVPEAFVKQNEARIRKNKIPKWSSIPIKWINISKPSEQKGKSYTFMLDTKDWPEGSYRLHFTAMFRSLGKGGKDKYVSDKFVFTLER